MTDVTDLETAPADAEAPEPIGGDAPAPAVPDGDRDAILDWVDAGARERAEQVLAVQDALPPEERDARLVVDLTAWLEGAVTDEAPASGDATSIKLPSTSAREQEMYEAELDAWQRENPDASPAVEAGDPPDDPGAVA
jgi:hypothetical protein